VNGKASRKAKKRNLKSNRKKDPPKGNEDQGKKGQGKNSNTQKKKKGKEKKEKPSNRSWFEMRKIQTRRGSKRMRNEEVTAKEGSGLNHRGRRQALQKAMTTG